MAKKLDDHLYDVYRIPMHLRPEEDDEDEQDRELASQAMYYVANHRLLYLYFFRRIETAIPPRQADDADAPWHVGGLRAL